MATPLTGAESALETMKSMAEYLKSAGRLFSSTRDGIEEFAPENFNEDGRGAVFADLTKLDDALWFLLPRQEVFIGDIGSYIEAAEGDGFDSPAQREEVWRAAVRKVDEIGSAAIEVLDVLSQGDSQLQIAIDDADRVALRSALMRRVTLLQRFGQMKPPNTSGEITQLKLLAERYAALHTEAHELHVSLQAALARFSG